VGKRRKRRPNDRERYNRDIDFSTLPEVGESSLEHATRHIPIRPALKGVGFEGLKKVLRRGEGGSLMALFFIRFRL
jgi:hypothetical protein